MRKEFDGLTDVHCHILPYVDDGARNRDEALAMLELQAQQGVSAVYLTPHHRDGMFETPEAEIIRSFESLQELANKMPKAPALYLGREYHCDGYLRSILNGTGPAPMTMGGGKCLLIEFSDRHSEKEILQYIGLVQHVGLQPVVAHAERYSLVEESLSAVENMIRCGAQIQVNSTSVLGGAGRKTKRLCLKLLKEDFVHFIGTDAHRTDVRTPNLAECADFVRRKVSAQQFEKIFYGNPGKIRS